MRCRKLGILTLFVVVVVSTFSLGRTWDQKPDLGIIKEVVNGNLTKITELLNGGDNVNTKDEHGWTPLIHAVKHSRLDTAKLLLDRGAEVNAQSVNGITALTLAASQGNLEIAKLLLDYGAYVEGAGVKVVSTQYLRRKNSPANEIQLQDTPLLRASAGGHKDIVDLLLAHGAYPNAKGFNGSTPLTEAYYYKEILGLLLDKGANINEQDNQGRTALMLSVMNHCYDSAKLLLDKGADVKLENSKGETALDLVRATSDRRIKLLFQGRVVSRP